MATRGTTTVEGYPALGFGPSPGSPAAVATLAQDVNGTYAKLKAADDVLTSIVGGSGDWSGSAADAFTAKVRELPKILGDATISFKRAAGALLDWQDQLTRMKTQAKACEDEAELARKRIRNAEDNPDLRLDGQQFPSQEEADQAQRRLDSAIERVNAARRDLDLVIADANRLLARHDEIADTVAQHIQKACEQAPDEPGFWDRLLDGIQTVIETHAQFANTVWDWVKDHANAISAIGDVFSTVSTVTGAIGLVLDATVIGAPVGAAFGLVSGVTAGVGLGLHATARFAGAEVSDRTLVEDGLGLVSFGIGKVAAKAHHIVDAPVAIYRPQGRGTRSGMAVDHHDDTGLRPRQHSPWLLRAGSKEEAAALGAAMTVPGLGPVVGLGMAFSNAWDKGSEKDAAAAEQRAGK